jgi:hypothetical protein
LFEKYFQPYEFVALIKRTLWGLTIQEVKPFQKFELLERAGNFVSVLQDLSVSRRVRRRLYIFLIQALVIALGVKSDPAPSFH